MVLHSASPSGMGSFALHEEWEWGQLSSLTVDGELQDLEFVLLRFFFGPEFPYCALISFFWNSDLNSLPLNKATLNLGFKTR